MYDWGNCKLPIVWANRDALAKMLARFQKANISVVIKHCWTVSTFEIKNRNLRKGWEENAQKSGAVLGTGLGAI
jgi:hypothetical protein